MATTKIYNSTAMRIHPEALAHANRNFEAKRWDYYHVSCWMNSDEAKADNFGTDLLEELTEVLTCAACGQLIEGAQ